MNYNRSFSTPRIGERKRPFGLLILMLLILVGGGFAGWFAHAELQRYFEDSIVVTLRDEVASRDLRIEQFSTERSSMRQRIAALERASQIDKAALLQLKMEIKENQSQRLKLEEELIFLRGVVAKDDGSEGLRVRNFRLTSRAEERAHRYRFTVTQVLSKRDSVRGTITISVVGKQDGKNKTLLLKEISEDGVDSLEMSFKHFQDVAGIVRLPEGFTPKTFAIVIKPSEKGAKELKKAYDWVVSN